MHQQSQIFSQKKSKRVTMRRHRSGHEQHEYEHIGDPVDYISNLPDCILHHILSFMPTKEVVKTSILSTRWKNLWAFVPNIDFYEGLSFDHREVDGMTSFMNFVERVLRLRDASNIDKFHLWCSVCNNASKIQSWISYAIMHNVQELVLSLFAVNPSVIPRSMFHSTSLVTLKISMYCAIQLPSHVSFPCLKTLHLSSVGFLNDDFARKLFSGCPVLEELVLFTCSFSRNLKNIAISSSTLKSLTIRDLSHFGALDDPSGCKIKIDAEKLTYFEYYGYLSNEIILINISSLDEAFIHIPCLGVRLNEVASRAIYLLKRLKYVVSLRLSNHTLKSLLFSDCLPICFPMFPNLNHLTLTTEIGMNHTFRVLTDFLSLFPVLQSICFSEGFKPNMDLGENNTIWSTIPTCISNCLKTVTFKNFLGSNSELCFLKCVLKYACVLERIDIWWCEIYGQDLKKKTKVREELEKIGMSSTTCIIKFL